MSERVLGKFLVFDSKRMTAEEADYMELSGAVKDADCHKVEVDGGVSEKLGCCNEFKPQTGEQQFRCGTCKFLKEKL
jgi:hypothetical protein